MVLNLDPIQTKYRSFLEIDGGGGGCVTSQDCWTQVSRPLLSWAPALLHRARIFRLKSDQGLVLPLQAERF